MYNRYPRGRYPRCQTQVMPGVAAVRSLPHASAPPANHARTQQLNWREYHEATKHSVESLRRSPHLLDWQDMPDPFRHYEGVPLLDLPADSPPLESPAPDGATFLSQLLFGSAAISATKRVAATGYRYALRVNPSSGNLHPTEFHFLTRGLSQWPDGLYHYRPSSHMAEQRAVGDIGMKMADQSASVVFILTSIAWREAWKYRERAYRYCLHDIGHAWQALAMAAQAMGCEIFARGNFSDDEVSRACGLPDDEWPMLILELRGRNVPVCAPLLRENVWYGGQANKLSRETIQYPLLNGIHKAAKLRDTPLLETSPSHPAATLTTGHPFGEVARRRRSALNFVGGSRSMSQIQLSNILSAATLPFPADFTVTTRFVRLYLYIHLVEGLEPGLYRHTPEGELELIRTSDQRVIAAGLSLGQDLAGTACVAFSMIGDLEGSSRVYGDRGYRYVHFEAGAIGHRLYLAAEASGLGATGIGAFYDDEVHRYLNLTPALGQVVYHFAIGYPVRDDRLEA